jgi:hypothetical protein
MGAVETNAGIRRVTNGTFVSERNLPTQARRTVCFHFGFSRAGFRFIFFGSSFELSLARARISWLLRATAPRFRLRNSLLARVSGGMAFLENLAIFRLFPFSLLSLSGRSAGWRAPRSLVQVAMLHGEIGLWLFGLRR